MKRKKLFGIGKKTFLNVPRESPVCRYLTALSTVSDNVPIRVMAESLLILPFPFLLLPLPLSSF